MLNCLCSQTRGREGETREDTVWFGGETGTKGSHQQSHESAGVRGSAGPHKG